MNPNIVEQRGSIDQYWQIYLILLEEAIATACSILSFRLFNQQFDFLPQFRPNRQNLRLRSYAFLD
ncbi:hypothetical protein [Microcoleus sp. D2_18a_D3]|uniref:hypothetical protein n=1 Tax=Microcoleus sp. D2_18a_D3 TaxID=3055330 RepID=UPI002FD72ED3